jgi:AcrR family transcriptional regulator
MSSRSRRTEQAAPSPSSVHESWPESKRQLYESALDLFWRQGYETNSVQEIVDHAGYTKGALYHHFSSKDEIARLIHDSYLDDIIPRLKVLLELDPRDPTVLEQLVYALFTSVQDHRREISQLHVLSLLDDKTFAATKAKRDELESLVVELVERAISIGVLRTVGNARLMTFALLGICSYAQYWWHEDGDLTPDQLVAVFTDMYVNGVTAAK